MKQIVQHGHWRLADAKNRFSELARLVFSKGPQKITRREGNLIVISEKDYLEIKGGHMDFKTFLLQETPDLTNLSLKRDKTGMRDIPL